MNRIKYLLVTLTFGVSLHANASTYQYTCIPAKKNPQGLNTKLSLTVSPDVATVNMVDGSYKSSGKINPKFSPRTNKNMLQYIQFDKYEDYLINVLVENTLPTGGRKLENGGVGGIITIRAQWDDFQTGSYICKK